MLCLDMQPFLPPFIQLRLGSTLNRFQTFSFLHRPTSHNWYKTAAPVGWSVRVEVSTVGTSLSDRRANWPTKQPTNRPTGKKKKPKPRPLCDWVINQPLLGRFSLQGHSTIKL